MINECRKTSTTWSLENPQMWLMWRYPPIPTSNGVTRSHPEWYACVPRRQHAPEGLRGGGATEWFLCVSFSPMQCACVFLRTAWDSFCCLGLDEPEQTFVGNRPVQTHRTPSSRGGTWTYFNFSSRRRQVSSAATLSGAPFDASEARGAGITGV